MPGPIEKTIPFGLYEKSLPDSLDWEERLICTRDAGYSFMELSIDETDERISRLDWDITKKIELRDISEKTGIPFISMCLSANRRFPIGSSYPDIQKKGLEIIISAIYFAFQTGIRIIQVAGYDVIDGEKSTDISRKTFGINLGKCLKLASSLGVMLAIENVDSKFADSLDKIMKYVKDFNSPWLQIYPDIGNLTAMGQDVEKQLKNYGSHVLAVHVKDTKPGVVRNIPFGEGSVDFISAFDTLREIDFYGPMLLEMWADNDKDNFTIIKNSRTWLIDKLKQSRYPIFGIAENLI
jgi:predicted hexulose-6-phosphate isomerase